VGLSKFQSHRVLTEIPVDGGAVFLSLIETSEGTWLDMRLWKWNGEETVPTEQGCTIEADRESIGEVGQTMQRLWRRMDALDEVEDVFDVLRRLRARDKDAASRHNI